MASGVRENPEMDPALFGLYRRLHAHPEFGFQEHRTAALVAERLTDLDFDVSTGVGRTGVVGVLGNGPGPTVLLRADMDGLSVREETGLDYPTSTERTSVTN